MQFFAHIDLMGGAKSGIDAGTPAKAKEFVLDDKYKNLGSKPERETPPKGAAGSGRDQLEVPVGGAGRGRRRGNPTFGGPANPNQPANPVNLDLESIS
jgi:hypothetical protein